MGAIGWPFEQTDFSLSGLVEGWTPISIVSLLGLTTSTSFERLGLRRFLQGRLWR